MRRLFNLYSVGVNIELIAGEIEKLQRIRAILKELWSPQLRTGARRQPARQKRLPPIAAQSEPRLLVLPPKQRREYTPRAKAIRLERRALAAPASDRPIFVPKAAIRESRAANVTADESNLEAVMRQR